MEKISTDLVIIGAGGAGLPAALTAQENGVKDVVLIEKRFATGGEAQYAGGMIFATGTRHQKEKGWYLSPDDKFLKAIEFCHYDIVKPEILRSYIDKTVTNIDWIEKTSGVEYECVSCHGQPSMDNTTHVPVGLDRPTMSFSRVTLQWIKHFKENGGKVLTNTDGMSIVKDGGRAVGVMARTRDGRDIDIKAKAVIIATGCFSKNATLMHQRFPDRYPASSDTVDQRGRFCDFFGDVQTGDGVVMGKEAGVALSERSCLCRETGFCFGDIMTFSSRLPVRASHAAPCIWANKRGERFHEKSMSNDNTASNAVYSQPEHTGYAVFDDAMLDRFEKEQGKRGDLPGKEYPTREPIEDQFKKGNNSVFIGNSWDDVAAYIGAKPEKLKATIEEYNSYCDKGHDDLFNKKPENLWAFRRPPFYILKFVDDGKGNPYGILETTKYMEALDKDYNIIPGLYIAGVLVAGFSGWDYHMFGTGLGFSLSSGRIAGERAAKYIKDIKT
jgi:fumarate reductase flavoprotein subunit